MKTAVTTWNNRVSPVFDVTGKALLFVSEGEVVYSEQQLLLPDASTAEKVACLIEAGTDVLICGAISRNALATVISTGIRVYPFIAGDIREVIQACLADRLVGGGFAMPGCVCRMACLVRGKHVRGREHGTGSALSCLQVPDNKEV